MTYWEQAVVLAIVLIILARAARYSYDLARRYRDGRRP